MLTLIAFFVWLALGMAALRQSAPPNFAAATVGIHAGHGEDSQRREELK